jgi:hypothetical protein
MKKISIILFAFVIAAFGAYEAKAVESQTQSSSAGQFVKVAAAGAQFLKIGPGARANGMAGAYTSVTDDATSLFWNPAGIADVRKMTGNFSYTQWFSDFTHSFGAFVMPVGDNYKIGLSLTSFGCNKIEVSTLEQGATGTYYSVNDLAVGLSFGGYLTSQFSFGVTAKLVNNAISDLNATSIAFDIGTMYQTGIQGIKLGFSMFNLGTQMSYTGKDLNDTKRLYDALYAQKLDVQYLTTAYSMPLIFRAGISSDVFTDEENNVIAALDFITHSDAKEQFALGGEWTWKKLLSVRAGWNFGQDQMVGISGGIGLNYVGGGFGGKIDYSITPTKDIGLINRISVNLELE